MGVAGCGGDLAQMSGGGEGEFRQKSESFDLQAGDRVDVVWSLGAASNDGDFSVTLVLGGSADDAEYTLVATSTDETDSTRLDVKESGTYWVSASGYNSVFSVDVSKN